LPKKYKDKLKVARDKLRKALSYKKGAFEILVRIDKLVASEPKNRNTIWRPIYRVFHGFGQAKFARANLHYRPSCF